MDPGQHTLAITWSGNIPHKVFRKDKGSHNKLPITHLMVRISDISALKDDPKNHGSIRYILEELNDRKSCHEAFRIAL